MTLADSVTIALVSGVASAAVAYGVVTTKLGRIEEDLKEIKIGLKEFEKALHGLQIRHEVLSALSHTSHAHPKTHGDGE